MFLRNQKNEKFFIVKTVGYGQDHEIMRVQFYG